MKLSIEAYYSFIKGMALVYLIVGILNSTGLYLLGIPHAILFGFVAAVLTLHILLNPHNKQTRF